ncbi:FAD-dependent oxidoreductase, partial [Thermodesulfobacteriota bacterium]
MAHLPHLFSPVMLGKVEIRNRIAMPPMHTGFGGEDGSITERIIDYYEARARGGAGLIIVEVSLPNGVRKYVPKTLGLFDDSQIAGWSKLVKRIRAQGARVAVQILDPGPGSRSALSGRQPMGPSPVAERDIRELPREMTIEEIEEVIKDFAEAARRAREAGLDAIEIHAAHGYAMVGSFLSSYYNKRTDEYGGSLEGRAKFLVDMLQAIRQKVGQDFPVIVRISGDDRVPGGRTLQETQFLAPMIVEAGASALEISGGTVPNAFWAVVPPAGTPLALNAEYARAVKQAVDVPVICVGRINSPKLAEFVLESQKADMVSMGRALMADPEMPNKAQTGNFEDIVPCIGDNQGCLTDPFGKIDTSCTMNPALGREKEMVIAPASVQKRVVVAGGGPAGLEAARVAALRGHDVTLLEKEGKLGGQINIASVPPGKQEISQMVKYLSRQVEKAGVRVELNTSVTPDRVEELKPVCMGGMAIRFLIST